MQGGNRGTSAGDVRHDHHSGLVPTLALKKLIENFWQVFEPTLCYKAESPEMNTQNRHANLAAEVCTAKKGSIPPEANGQAHATQLVSRDFGNPQVVGNFTNSNPLGVVLCQQIYRRYCCFQRLLFEGVGEQEDFTLYEPSS
jgi:hypothetical protein